jgi:serine/threonine-protein kinase
VDWGDARARESEALQLMPSDWLAYQPPEVRSGDPADSRADVYALGVIAYEALAGTKPTTAAARRVPFAPARLLALLDRMVAQDPLVRPTSAEVRAEALAIVELIEVPLPQPADEDGPDVQIEDVELGLELAPDLELDEHARTRTMPPDLAIDPPIDPPIELSRTKTEPMMPDHLTSRTMTEPMLMEPEPRLPRTSTRIGKVVLPPRVLEPSRTKTT